MLTFPKAGKVDGAGQGGRDLYYKAIFFFILSLQSDCSGYPRVKCRDWHFGFETSRFQNFCQIFEGFGFGFGKFGFGKKVSGFGFKKIWSRKKVSVSVSENLVSEKKSRFRFWKNLVSEKSLGFGFGKFGLGRKVSVSVSEKFGLGKKSRFRFRKIWYRKKSLGIGFGQNFVIVIQCLPHVVPKSLSDHWVILEWCLHGWNSMGSMLLLRTGAILHYQCHIMIVTGLTEELRLKSMVRWPAEKRCQVCPALWWTTNQISGCPGFCPGFSSEGDLPSFKFQSTYYPPPAKMLLLTLLSFRGRGWPTFST